MPGTSAATAGLILTSSSCSTPTFAITLSSQWSGNEITLCGSTGNEQRLKSEAEISGRGHVTKQPINSSHWQFKLGGKFKFHFVSWLLLHLSPHDPTLFSALISPLATMDAQLNDLIRLKQPPAAPVERWQRLPTRERLSRSTTVAPASISSPLRIRTPSHANMALKKTPEPSKFAVKYRHSPKAGICKTPGKTPKRTFGTSKTPGQAAGKTPHRRRTPPKSAKKKTPGRAGLSPSGCRFIPNRYRN